MDWGNNATIGPLVCSPLAVTPPAEDLYFPPFHAELYAGEQMLPKSNKEPPTPDSLPNTESSRRRSRGKLRHSRPPPRKRSSAFDIVSPSRNLQELLCERSYVSSDLQRHSAHARGLIQECDSLEQQLEHVTQTKHGNRLEKRLKYLRSQLGHNAEQERIVMTRLSELQLELQYQEYWMQAQHQRAVYQCAVTLDTATSYFNLPPQAALRPPLQRQTVLDGSISEFIPRSMGADLSRSSESTFLGTVDEDWDDFSNNHDLQFEYACEEPYNENEAFDFWDGELIRVRTRRLSLPNLQSVRPEQDCQRI